MNTKMISLLIENTPEPLHQAPTQVPCSKGGKCDSHATNHNRQPFRPGNIEEKLLKIQANTKKRATKNSSPV